MGRRLTPEERAQRQRAKVEEREEKEATRDAKRREIAINRYIGASAIGRRMLESTPEEIEARKYRRRHLRKQWLFAKKATNHKGMLEERRNLRRAATIGKGYEDDDDYAGYERPEQLDDLHTEDTKEETQGPKRKRLYARDLLPRCETMVA